MERHLCLIFSSDTHTHTVLHDDLNLADAIVPLSTFIVILLLLFSVKGRKPIIQVYSSNAFDRGTKYQHTVLGIPLDDAPLEITACHMR